MKLLPPIQISQLPPVSAAGGMAGMEPRLPSSISLPLCPDWTLWRAQYGASMGFPPTTHPPPSSLLDFKTHLPTNLGKYHKKVKNNPFTSLQN